MPCSLALHPTPQSPTPETSKLEILHLAGPPGFARHPDAEVPCRRGLSLTSLMGWGGEGSGPQRLLGFRARIKVHRAPGLLKEHREQMHFSAIQPGASKAPRRGGLSANSRLADGLGASAGLGLWVLGLGASTSQTKHVWNLKHHTHTDLALCRSPVT